MALVMRSAGLLKPEIRLQQTLKGFFDELDLDQRQEYLNDRDFFCKTRPAENDVAVFIATLNRQMPQTPYGTRFLNILQVVQQFAAIGDILVGGSQNLIACGIWSAVRLTLELVVKAKSNLDKLSHMFMVAGRSAPRYEAMARLYIGKTNRLWSYYYEYFIVLVGICRRLINIANKSSISRFFYTIDASDISGFESELSYWASVMKEETTLLMALGLEHQGSRLDSVMSFSVNEAQRWRRQIKDQVLSACSLYDYQASWKRLRRKGNTGLFLRDSAYLSWKENTASNINKSKTLIYTGKLGCGKSVLIANMLEDLQLHNQPSQATVAYFFCQHDDVESLRASTIIGSIVRQLLQPISDLSRAASIIQGRPRVTDVDDWLLILSASLHAEAVAFCMIDGLDECCASEQQFLVDTLRKLQAKFRLRVCLSFRQEADNAFRFDPLSFADCKTTTIPEDNPELEKFIHDELGRCIETDRLVLGDPALITEIVDALVEHSRGMFLWVVLQISSLCAAKTDVEVRTALADLPKDLAETFSRVLKKCALLDENYQKQTLELVLGAIRPLTTEELREALAVVAGDTNWEPLRVPNNIYSVLASCGAILTLDEETQSLRLVHQSAKDFLLGNFHGTAEEPLFLLSQAKLRMAETVITYLNCNIFNNQLSSSVGPAPRASSTPAAVIQSVSTAKVVKDLTLKILRSKKLSSPNLELDRLLADARGVAKRATGNLPHPFYSYASIYWLQHACFGLEAASNLHHLVSRMLGQNVVDVTRKDDFGRTPLLWAAMHGHATAVKLFLDRRMEFDIRDFAGQTALSLASHGGHTSIVELLIECGADLESTDCRGRTPLWLAVSEGHISVVGLLIEKGANLESEDRQGRTPLWLAASEGHNFVVELLVQKGADLEKRNGHVIDFFSINAAFSVAVEAVENKSITHRFAQETALFAAARSGHEETVRTLVEKGVNLQVMDEHGETPLHHAMRSGQGPVFKFLFEKSSERLPPGTLGLWDELLHFAVNNHFAAAAEFLINQGIDLEISNRFGQTPLHEAAKSGDETILKMLIKHGARLQISDRRGQTPLWTALRQGHEPIVRILFEALIKNGAEAEGNSLEGDTSLVRAIAYRQEPAVSALAKKGAAVDGTNFTDNIPLWWAVMLGDDTVVKVLIENGANLETRDSIGQTPLLWAVCEGQETIVQILVENGANPEVKYDKGGTSRSWVSMKEWTDETPLYVATQLGHKAVVKLLIDNGANLEVMGPTGRKPLHEAARLGDEAIVQMLIEKGADLKSKSNDIKRQTPLDHAAENGHQAIVKLLLDCAAERSQLTRIRGALKRF